MLRNLKLPHIGTRARSGFQQPDSTLDTAFTLDRRLLHGVTQVTDELPLTFITPPQQWAYAVELPRDETVVETAPVVIHLSLQVTQGAVGIGCLDAGGALIVEIERTTADGATEVELPLTSLAACQSLILRNTSPAYTASSAVIRSIAVRRGPAERPSPPPEIAVDPALFSRFGRWEGVTPAGYWTDWLGVRTRAEVWAFTEDFLAVYNSERFERPELPLDSEHALDWVPLLEAVIEGGDPFTIVALGAGWGRWLTAGAFAAQRIGRAYRLVGVEAEPTHFQWLQRHMRDNHIRSDWARLVHGAASSISGECWFRVGDAAAWYGQSILADAAVPEIDGQRTELWSTVKTGDLTLQRVRSFDVADVVGDLPVVDYMHMDIQASELDFLSAKPEVLNARVRQINIGTHSESIERGLKRFFESLGWVLRYEVPLNGQAYVRLGSAKAKLLSFGDGVQVWANPRLNTAARS